VEKLAYNLKRIRREKKLTQEALADKLGINRTTYARYEDDVVAPPEILDKIHKMLKVEFVEFVKEIPHYVENKKQGKEIKLPQTYAELIALYKEVIASLKRELEVKDKYILLLESRAK
jgi:transcriptional regulator with XRE-family HTH domain